MIIQIFGASGCGKSTLAALLSQQTGLPILSSDHYLWPDNHAFITPRPVEERRRLLREDLRRTPSFLFDGNVRGWEETTPFTPDLLVFLQVSPTLRMQRLKARETARYGERILPGGDHEEASRTFLEWCASYETMPADESSTSLAAHRQWILSAPCPVLLLDGARSAQSLATEILSHLD